MLWPRKRRRTGEEIPAYVDSPAGIFTPAGTRFSTTVALLEEYAAEVLERAPLETLIRDAEVWLRSAQTVAVWLLIVGLLLMSPLAAGLLALAVFVGWDVLAPSLVNRPFTMVFRWFEQPLIQALLYVVVLSLLGNAGELVAVGVGLVGFIAFRWQLVALATRPLRRWLHERVYALPPADHVLRTLVLKAAIRYGISLPQLAALRPRWFGRGA